jgi:hypothetical protein
MSTLWRVIADPIRGITPLWKVAVLYSIVGGGILSVAMQVAAAASPAALRVFGFVALVYGAYVALAVFRCARNCGSRELALVVRIAAGLSLLMLPFLTYLIFTGRVAFAT